MTIHRNAIRGECRFVRWTHSASFTNWVVASQVFHKNQPFAFKMDHPSLLFTGRRWRSFFYICTEDL